MSHPHPFENFVEIEPVSMMSRSELREKETALRNISQALHGVMFAGPTPREQQVIVSIVVAFVAAITLLPLFDFKKDISQILLMLIVGVIVFKGCMLWRTTDARSWGEILDTRLAEYTPLNREAFAHLQNELKVIGCLDSLPIRIWLEAEEARYQAMLKRVVGAPATQFLQKQI